MKTPGREKFEIFEHTADTGLIIYGDSLEDFFRNAAEGFFHLIVEGEKAEPSRKFIIEAEEESPDMLLVGFLQELNFLHQTEGIIYAGIEFEEIDENSIRAVVEGETPDPDKHSVVTEIKAVTLHKLYVEKKNGRYEGRVLFDI